jgi:hypothetical protein
MTWLWIQYQYVPASTTRAAQLCDVEMPCLTKLVIKKCQHEDIINKTLLLLQALNTAPHTLRLDTTIGTLHDQSV